MRITSITPMKNEGPYILEWVAHNRSIGINDMLVFTNDCTDPTYAILDRLDEMGLLRHAPNPSVRMNKPRHHIELIRYIDHMTRLRRSDWVTNLDVDEFVRVKTGAGKLEDLFNAVPDADAITLSLHTYGCGGIDDIAPNDGLVTETFNTRGDSSSRSSPVKYFARGGFPWDRFLNNSVTVHEKDRERVNWVNGNGVKLPRENIDDSFKNLPASTSGFDLVDVAHYTIRSFRGFLLQRDRGDANPQKGVRPAELDVEKAMKYWRRFNLNDVQDDFSAGGNPDLKAAVDDLLKDPELRHLHTAALAWHRARADELLQRPLFAQLYANIKAEHAKTYPS